MDNNRNEVIFSVLSSIFGIIGASILIFMSNNEFWGQLSVMISLLFLGLSLVYKHKVIGFFVILLNLIFILFLLFNK